MEGNILKFMPLWPNCKLGKYLGQGAYGEVWELIVKDDNGSTHNEAVKEILVPPFSSGSLEGAKLQGLDIDSAKKYYESVLKATVEEASMQCALSECETIVQFYGYQVKNLSEIGKYGWSIYIRMEILQSFNDFLLTRRISYEDIARLGIDIAKALETCQKHNLVHRDIKPDNLFYDSKKHLFKLGDFGISHYLDRPTAGKGKAGTLTHMPPEVYAGEDFGFSSDLYALGMILYKLLNDNRIPCLPPYPTPYDMEERDKALVNRLRGAILEYPASYKRNMDIQSPTIRYDASVLIKDKLCKIATKAIDADEKRRYKNASAFREVLESCLEDFERGRLKCI